MADSKTPQKTGPDVYHKAPHSEADPRGKRDVKSEPKGTRARGEAVAAKAGGKTFPGQQQASFGKQVASGELAISGAYPKTAIDKGYATAAAVATSESKDLKNSDF